MSWYVECWKNYAVFGGRARRAEYWMFVLINMLVLMGLGVVDFLLGTAILHDLYCFAVFLPGLAVGVRRLHDTGHSGWWLLIGIIPIIGGIVLLFFMISDSQPGENRFGPNPKAIW